MTDDRTLLEKAARAAGPLVNIGELAVREHAAWVTRNAVRLAFHGWLKKYRRDTGEWFEVGTGEPEDDAMYYALREPVKPAQQALSRARAATRRAIVRAAASLGFLDEERQP